ncbi:hypothetical protein B6V73_19175 [Thioclava sp. JM3]|nr:hypothetical protein B6V73_19175 [Thioclava sp. JM3]
MTLLLARKSTERPELTHGGKVVTMSSKIRWCSDGFEVTCRSGDLFRVTFILDAHDRKIISWRVVLNAAISERTSAT